MALVVETGSGVTGANTFIGVDDVIAAAADYNVTLTNTPATTAMILSAADFLKGIDDWKGAPVSDFQSLPWPRQNVYIGASLWDATVIPPDVIAAQVQLVIAQVRDQLSLTFTQQGALVIQETVGPITTKYSDRYGVPATASVDDIPAVSALLARWRDDGGMFRTVRA